LTQSGNHTRAAGRRFQDRVILHENEAGLPEQMRQRRIGKARNLLLFGHADDQRDALFGVRGGRSNKCREKQWNK
jgi:hypothetical protein